LSAWRNGEIEAARGYFEQILADFEAPGPTRERAQLMLSLVNARTDLATVAEQPVQPELPGFSLPDLNFDSLRAAPEASLGGGSSGLAPAPAIDPALLPEAAALPLIRSAPQGAIGLAPAPAPAPPAALAPVAPFLSPFTAPEPASGAAAHGGAAPLAADGGPGSPAGAGIDPPPTP
jgi:hypothetical protein